MAAENVKRDRFHLNLEKYMAWFLYFILNPFYPVNHRTTSFYVLSLGDFSVPHAKKLVRWCVMLSSFSPNALDDTSLAIHPQFCLHETKQQYSIYQLPHSNKKQGWIRVFFQTPPSESHIHCMWKYLEKVPTQLFTGSFTSSTWSALCLQSVVRRGNFDRHDGWMP